MAVTNPKSARDAIAFLKSLGVMIFPDAQGHVENVHLWEDRTSDDTLCILPSIPGLKRLSLQGARITDKGLENLASLTNLEELDLRSCKKITDKGMSSVSKLMNLKAIQLYDTQIGDRGLDQLTVLKSLESLNIHSTQVTDAGLEALKGFPKLSQLELGGKKTRLTDNALMWLAGLTKIDWLVLSESQFTDACLVHLQGLVRLKLLYIAWTPITGYGFKHLAALSKMENLHAVESLFNDDGMKWLAPLHALKSLGLSGTKVSDKGLPYLSGLKKLRSLGLEKTRVTKAGKAKLKQALPRCVVRISKDQGEVDLGQFDPEYFWTHPPRCIAGFKCEPARQESATTFQLICRCGSRTGRVLGYPLTDHKPDYSGPLLFVTPLAFSCTKCDKTTEIIDTEDHGYNAEIGSDSNIRGKGQPQAFPCPKCGSAEMKVLARFGFDGAELDLKADEPSIDVENYVGSFSGTCVKCGKKFPIGNYELA